jgi:hypothetical protein
MRGGIIPDIPQDMDHTDGETFLNKALFCRICLATVPEPAVLESGPGTSTDLVLSTRHQEER